MRPPVQSGQNVIMDIEDIGMAGEGIGHVQGYAVFVPGVLPGEKARVGITHAGRSMAHGRCLEVLVPSVNRVQPPCPYFGACGGCQLQHLSYEGQLQFKQNQVQQALRRIAGVDVEVSPIVGADGSWRYRNKAQFPVGGRKGDVQVGFYRPSSHDLINIADCLIQPHGCARAAEALRKAMAQLGVEPYREQDGSGYVRHLLVRTNTSGDILATLVTNGWPVPHIQQLADALMAVPGMVGVVQNNNTRRDNVILGRENRLLAGRETLEETVMGNRWQVSPLSFLQINPKQMEKLYALAVSAATEGLEKPVVLDAYCGIGTMTLALALKARLAYGVEIVSAAIEDARRAARENGIDNVCFEAADAGEQMKKWVAQGRKFDSVVVDPPRKGCSEAFIGALLEAGPGRIVYVSCNPATLARDIKALAAGGYRIDRCTPVDMFPQTVHVETVCLLVRRNSLHINIDVDVEEMLQEKHGQATYPQIKEYVLEHTGLKVSSLYISQIKRKCGLDVGDSYNKPKSEDAKQPQCPPEKEEAIKSALKHFGMI
nr:23S rRNA (uracil(1939)-C(5))-methyltransferase RlmD [bacterium]